MSRRQDRLTNFSSLTLGMSMFQSQGSSISVAPDVGEKQDERFRRLAILRLARPNTSFHPCASARASSVFPATSYPWFPAARSTRKPRTWGWSRRTSRRSPLGPFCPPWSGTVWSRRTLSSSESWWRSCWQSSWFPAEISRWLSWTARIHSRSKTLRWRERGKSAVANRWHSRCFHHPWAWSNSLGCPGRRSSRCRISPAVASGRI